MDTISGVPAHPLLVHIPVVLLPLAAVGVLLMAVRRTWYFRFRWAVLAITAVGAIGAVLAAAAGDSLEERLESAGERNTWGDHVEAGETARNVALLFLALVAVYVIVPWVVDRRQLRHQPARSLSAAADPGGADAPGRLPRWVVPALAVASLGVGTASIVTVIDAGHSGAKSAWSEEGGR